MVLCVSTAPQVRQRPVEQQMSAHLLPRRTGLLGLAKDSMKTLKRVQRPISRGSQDRSKAGQVAPATLNKRVPVARAHLLEVFTIIDELLHLTRFKS